jgi:hypothetical protein
VQGFVSEPFEFRFHLPLPSQMLAHGLGDAIGRHGALSGSASCHRLLIL